MTKTLEHFAASGKGLKRGQAGGDLGAGTDDGRHAASSWIQSIQEMNKFRRGCSKNMTGTRRFIVSDLGDRNTTTRLAFRGVSVNLILSGSLHSDPPPLPYRPPFYSNVLSSFFSFLHTNCGFPVHYDSNALTGFNFLSRWVSTRQSDAILQDIASCLEPTDEHQRIAYIVSPFKSTINTLAVCCAISSLYRIFLLGTSETAVDLGGFLRDLLGDVQRVTRRRPAEYIQNPIRIAGRDGALDKWIIRA
ncbi:hypothetical protein ACJZ2D_006577 [Fusarium nematophilum]